MRDLHNHNVTYLTEQFYISVDNSEEDCTD
nr:MAG TPA: hypothetical protein [Caudoviricetes sp.]DAU98528.1 MAG TPA: hypothetical protein [Caudoviricetes sp.]